MCKYLRKKRHLSILDILPVPRPDVRRRHINDRIGPKWHSARQSAVCLAGSFMVRRFEQGRRPDFLKNRWIYSYLSTS